MAATKRDPKARRAWQRRRIECLETRREVTAYSGDTGPWLPVRDR
ncbi:hypothetical protein [Phytohabitans kaempferiae]|uniref:Uncharacterized protein n=1 Tax=Phytohabitans kaempferiae TaxID=1620943 RepID=A0ABV6LXZ0_9ACTN